METNESIEDFEAALLGFLDAHHVDSEDKLELGIRLLGEDFAGQVRSQDLEVEEYVPPFTILARATGEYATDWLKTIEFRPGYQTEVDAGFLDPSSAILTLARDPVEINGKLRRLRCRWINGFKICY